MNKKIKKQWVAALRSGEYEQGRHDLRTKDNKFCCLGVLTDLYAKEKGLKWEFDNVEGAGHSFRLPDEKGEIATAALTESVMKWAGIVGDYFGDIKDEEGERTLLSSLNDHYIKKAGGTPEPSHNFNAIASLIEAQL